MTALTVSYIFFFHNCDIHIFFCQGFLALLIPSRAWVSHWPMLIPISSNISFHASMKEHLQGYLDWENDICQNTTVIKRLIHFRGHTIALVKSTCFKSPTFLWGSRPQISSSYIMYCQVFHLVQFPFTYMITEVAVPTSLVFLRWFPSLTSAQVGGY